MGISDFISRLTDYYSRHGFSATIRRAGLGAKRAVFSSRMVVFYCDLATETARPVNITNSMEVNRLQNEAEISQQDLLEIISFWNPKQARRNIKERFAKGASLWLIKSEDKVAGFGWTLHGCTVEPHYFPLGQDDVHLFDFHVFPRYRGRGINPLLVICILRELAVNCTGRAFIEAAEWNQAQLASLQKTPFRRLGSARWFTVFGHTFTTWDKLTSAEQARQANESRSKMPVVVSSHER